MPGMDGTGPRGMGPMTGGARGWCNPYSPLGAGGYPYGGFGAYAPGMMPSAPYGMGAYGGMGGYGAMGAYGGWPAAGFGMGMPSYGGMYPYGLPYGRRPFGMGFGMGMGFGGRGMRGGRGRGMRW